MAWTYDPTNLDKETEEGRKNIVRFTIGDTDEGDPQVQDEEILFCLDSAQNKIYTASAMAVGAIFSKYSRLVNVELDEAIREDYSDLMKNYQLLKKELEDKSKLENGSIRILATGLTWTDFEKARTDPERIRPGIEQMKWKRGENEFQAYGYRYLT